MAGYLRWSRMSSTRIFANVVFKEMRYRIDNIAFSVGGLRTNLDCK